MNGGDRDVRDFIQSQAYSVQHGYGEGNTGWEKDGD